MRRASKIHLRSWHAMVAAGAFLAVTAVALAGPAMFNSVQPQTYDPSDTDLVQTGWVAGIGCPTNQPTNSNGGAKSNGTFTDPACPTGDPNDPQNEGLLMAKTGPTANYAAAQVQLQNVKGVTLSVLGYDIRKVNSPSDPRGSHCGAGAPRFNVQTTTGVYFIGCNSPPPTSQSGGTPGPMSVSGTGPGSGWLRLRWGTGSPGSVMGYLNGETLTAVTGTVQSIYIVADEGQDVEPTYSGLSVLDNIDVSGTLVGHGPGVGGS